MSAFARISKNNRSRDMFHTLCLNPASHWRRLSHIHPRVDASFADRGRSIRFCSPLITPLCAAEKMVYGSTIANRQLEHDPIFILGHWRSGTTLLHNLLSKDPQFGFVTLFQTLAPGSFLLGRRSLQPLLALRAPSTRPMDNVKIRMHYPSEEEFALAHLCPQSAYLGWYFPHDWSALFSKYALMQGISPEGKREWADTYRELLVKASINFNGRQLVLKNPVNTCRIRAVRELFPNAKFIHIHRNPYDVLRATLHMFREVLKTVTLQEITEKRVEEYVLEFYPQMMRAYWEQRDEIPEGHHAEIRYDDLVADPLGELERVYSELGLRGWSEARAPIARLLGSRSGHQRNEYRGEATYRALVDEHWGFAFDRLGYDRRVAAASAV